MQAKYTPEFKAHALTLAQTEGYKNTSIYLNIPLGTLYALAHADRVKREREAAIAEAYSKPESKQKVIRNRPSWKQMYFDLLNKREGTGLTYLPKEAVFVQEKKTFWQRLFNR